MFAQILLIVFLFSVIVQLGYVFYFFSYIFLPEEKKHSLNNRKPVSVIICAKNEAENLRQNLPAILAQRYMNDTGIPMFEVIVVNDGSEDGTEEVLAGLCKEYAHLKTISIPPGADKPLPGKKTALNRGIATAIYETLLLTDADCQPTSNEWLELMTEPLRPGKTIVAGYGKFRKEAGWLNAFVRWETMHTFLQYSTYAKAGHPYMAVGRNMACTKEGYRKARQQSEAWSKLPSGDDDLLVNAIANKDNMVIVCRPEAFTLSDAKNNWKDWVKQKQRHLSTGKYYRTFAILALGCYASVHALTWLLFFLLVFVGDTEAVVTGMLVRSVVYWLIWAEAARKTGEKDLVLYFPLMDIGWMIYNFAFSPYVLWKNKRQWK